jgi:rhodanese-related sulfurtransferase
MRVISRILLGTMLGIAGLTRFAGATLVEDVPRISKEKLLSVLEHDDVVVIDVRQGKDWESSKWKIKGAIREDPKDVQSWANKYPKDRTLILYCA